MKTQLNTLILGIGNVLWADEGFGVRTLEVMQSQYTFPPEVTLMDGGTQGLYLVHYVRAADVVVVFDAVDFGLPPGTLIKVEGDEVPRFLGARKMSLHQTGFQEVLALADMFGNTPRQLLLIGVQPVELEDYGGSLRGAVKAQIQPAIGLALDYLAERGIVVRPRECDAAAAVPANALDMERYETERPSASAALRVGDARVILSGEFAISPRNTPIGDNRFTVGLDHHLGKYR